MINFTEKFFDLKLLKIKDILLHETTETNRLRNIFDRIATSKHLMNPVIVGLFKDEYFLIDGANRLSTLKEIGCKLTIAQVIDYTDKNIKLKNWNHLIYNLKIETILEYFKKRKIKFAEVKYSAGEKQLKKNLNSILISDIETGKSYIITLPKSFGEIVKELNAFTKLYFGKYIFDRSEQEIKFSELRKYSRKKGLLVEFTSFKKQNVIAAAKNNLCIPSGITRHILLNRVLHVRYEISKLKDENNLEKKNKDLKKYLINKIDSNKVRQYRESVIVFDE